MVEMGGCLSKNNFAKPYKAFTILCSVGGAVNNTHLAYSVSMDFY